MKWDFHSKPIGIMQAHDTRYHSLEIKWGQIYLYGLLLRLNKSMKIITSNIKFLFYMGAKTISVAMR